MYYYSDIFDKIPISKQLDIYGIVSEIWNIFINSRMLIWMKSFKSLKSIFIWLPITFQSLRIMGYISL